MKLSIALCTCEGARYLDAQLQSIGEQSRLPDEMVVFDDHSTDGTVSILRAFAAKAEFPVHIHVNERRLGSTENFEQAINHCAGDVIFLADQDDVWRREKLHRLEQVFRSMPQAGVVFSDALLVDENGRSLGFTASQCTGFRKREQDLLREGKAYRLLARRNVIVGATMAFRSSLRNLVLPIPGHLRATMGFAHDGWIALVTATVADVVFVDQVLVDYRRHPAQQIGLLLPSESRTTSDGKDGTARGGRLRYGTRAERTKFLSRLLDRVEVIYDALDKRDGAVDSGRKILSEFDGWKRHLRARLISLERRRRRSAVITELFRLGYHRYSHGFGSALGDLLAPDNGTNPPA